MKFSILMPNYNNAQFVAEAIESVVVQTYENWELLVLDDGSVDDSVKIIKQCLSDQRIKFFSKKQNKGKTQALKELMFEASGDIIVEFDSDDTLHKKTLAKISRAYEVNLDCGFVYSQCVYCDENLQPVHEGFSAAIPEGSSNLHENSVVAVRTYRKDLYQRTAGYDEGVKFAEDIDLVLKMEEVTKFLFVNEPLYYYRILKKSQSHSFLNTRINRSSTALAKMNAYKRRRNTAIPNLTKPEIAEVLYWGMINAILARRLLLAVKLKCNLFMIYPFFFVDYRFYLVVLKKIKKIRKLKKEKPLLSV